MPPISVSPQFASLAQDADLMDEIRERSGSGRLPQLEKFGVAPTALEAAVESAAATSAPRAFRAARAGAAPVPPQPGGVAAEAIVLQFGRPSLIVQNGTFELPESRTWREILRVNRRKIENAIARVGRVELFNHLSYEWVGTAWIIAPRTVVTNRHVAELFATRTASGWLDFAKNLLGVAIGAQVDFREEYKVDAAIEVRVTKILYVAERGEPDIALLQIASDRPLPEPIALSAKPIENRQTIGVIGYPAFDSRNGRDAMRRYFGDVYDVKRFAPGKVSFPTPQEHYFVHDCTTLGGNSGSKVVDLETGEAIGLHFAGEFLKGNFAVRTSFIKAALAKAKVMVSVPRPGPGAVPEAPGDGRHAKTHFKGRDGYRADFLGGGRFTVPLPGLGGWKGDAAPVAGAPSNTRYVARYRHFSVVVSKSRKLPILTAVNIDGRTALRIFRADDRWFFDGRFNAKHQVGNEVYKNNDLDRGHMVRRLDPVWGDRAEAEQANDDTFHYVNAVPQHRDLNQREWSELEDYILDNADAKDLEVSVFTGPVLREDDRPYRDLVRLPREFWKIAVLVNRVTDRLSATGYVLSQGDMIVNLTEAPFVFGEFRTYQVPISLIEQATGLDFHALRAFDPLESVMEAAGAAGPRAVLVRSARDLVFH